MKAIMVMYDSLNRHYMPNYGSDIAKMPNFQRLGQRAVTFDNSYVGSMPCMPARREIHTGRLNFLHRSWCPLEPYDDSMPELLKNNGIYTHLVSDHQHYWEDGGCTYHTRYSTWDCSRGQEGDPWQADLAPIDDVNVHGVGPSMPHPLFLNMRRQDIVNRRYMPQEKDFPQAKTFNAGIEFIHRNHDFDNWFLQIETFDPHEPFFAPETYQALYREEGDPDGFEKDWPPYAPVAESADVVKGVRKKYRALLSMCDAYLGKVLDAMDRYDLWKDTMLIVNTDHGFLLGEREWWSKSVMPYYGEIAHTPLFIWDPRSGVKNERRQSLVQTIDLAPTLLDYFQQAIPKDMLGRSLARTIVDDTPVRTYGLFGSHGAQVNITDGRHVYMRSPIAQDNQPLFDYTLMPTWMRQRMPVATLQDLQLAEPFDFTKHVRLLKIPVHAVRTQAGITYRYGNKLYDLAADPLQMKPVDDPELEVRLINEMIALMKANDAPIEQYTRLGIPAEGVMTVEILLAQRAVATGAMTVAGLEAFDITEQAVWGIRGLQEMAAGVDPDKANSLTGLLSTRMKNEVRTCIDVPDVAAIISDLFPTHLQQAAHITLHMVSRTG